MIWRRKSVFHLGRRWWLCGWTWRGRFICKVCYPPEWRQLIPKQRTGA